MVGAFVSHSRQLRMAFRRDRSVWEVHGDRLYFQGLPIIISQDASSPDLSPLYIVRFM